MHKDFYYLLNMVLYYKTQQIGADFWLSILFGLI